VLLLCVVRDKIRAEVQIDRVLSGKGERGNQDGLDGADMLVT
jgi:hypothetical protein